MSASQCVASSFPCRIPIRQAAHNRSNRLRRQILRPQDFDRIVKLMIDHYVCGSPGEASAIVADRVGYSQEVVDAVTIAALVEARGDAAVHRHCQTLAVQMVAERRRDTRQEFAEWFRGRAA